MMTQEMTDVAEGKKTDVEERQKTRKEEWKEMSRAERWVTMQERIELLNERQREVAKIAPRENEHLRNMKENRLVRFDGRIWYALMALGIVIAAIGFVGLVCGGSQMASNTMFLGLGFFFGDAIIELFWKIWQYGRDYRRVQCNFSSWELISDRLIEMKWVLEEYSTEYEQYNVVRAKFRKLKPIVKEKLMGNLRFDERLYSHRVKVTMWIGANNEVKRCYNMTETAYERLVYDMWQELSAEEERQELAEKLRAEMK